MQLIFEQVRVGGDRNFGYLLGDREAKQGVLIDPSYSPEILVDRARAQGLTITHILNTHGHPDHTEGNTKASQLTGAVVSAHSKSPVKPEVSLEDGNNLSIGSLTLECMHVPGHAADHLVFYQPDHKILFTGDLLFVGKVGGTPTELDSVTEWDSLQRVIGRFPSDSSVWPGHDYGVRPSSTLDLEKRTNPFLLCKNRQAFLELKHSWPTFKQSHGLK